MVCVTSPRSLPRHPHPPLVILYLVVWLFIVYHYRLERTVVKAGSLSRPSLPSFFPIHSTRRYLLQSIYLINIILMVE